MPRRRRRTRRGSARPLIHTTSIRGDEVSDFKISAKGLGFLENRPTKVLRVSVTICADKPSLNCSFGLYSPLHAEAVVWSRSMLISTIPRTISIRSPRSTDWGHYNKDDSVIVASLLGKDGTTFRATITAWVVYGNSTKIVAPAVPEAIYENAGSHVCTMFSNISI
jgi:hypothetical protein